jgi:hypothetical protein
LAIEEFRFDAITFMRGEIASTTSEWSKSDKFSEVIIWFNILLSLSREREKEVKLELRYDDKSEKEIGR